MVDTAALSAALGHPCKALALLRSMTGLFSPLTELVAVDSSFEPLRTDPTTAGELAGWLADRRQE
jgi:hypothetical protein